MDRHGCAVLAAAGRTAAAHAVGGCAARVLRGHLPVQLVPLLLPVSPLLPPQAAIQRNGARADSYDDGQRHGGASAGDSSYEDQLPTVQPVPLAREYQPSAPPLSWDSDPSGLV